MPVALRRYIETLHGTLGQFVFPDDSTLFSMERMSTGEHPRIPAGLYELKLDYYHHGDYPAYEIIVPNRSRILIHAANKASELLGCIAPGLALGFIAGELAVLQSKLALSRFMKALKGAEQDYLTIQDPG